MDFLPLFAVMTLLPTAVGFGVGFALGRFERGRR